ncbi:hypothetical protein AAD018_007950 [Aestuariibius insulae]|uniref:hypothetical protein n=1 Tax=Aestuariibius insulae TaxID=2058287 RepID=UPI00345EBF0B
MRALLLMLALMPGPGLADESTDPCPAGAAQSGEIPLERVTIRYCETGDLVRLVIDDHDRQSVTVIDIPPVETPAE